MSGLGTKGDSNLVKVTKVDADVASIGFTPWDNPKEVTVSPMNLSSHSSVGFFYTS